MPWPRSSVPKFGNWDKNEDLSYSIVFDKVRAEKESSLHSSNGDFENSSSIRSLSPRSDGGSGSGTFQSSFPRAKKKNFLHTFEGNRRFARPHHNAPRSSEEGAEKGTFPFKNRTKEFGSSSPTVPSWQAAILRDHQNAGSQQYANHLQANPKKVSSAPTYNRLPVSGVPSSQSRQSGASSERQGHNQEHTKLTSLLGSGRHMYQEELANAKTRNHCESFDIQGKPIVPKFGDWDYGDGFTLLFDNVRKERSSKVPAPLETAEDLYEGSKHRMGGAKRRRGWLLSILCCFKPHT